MNSNYKNIRLCYYCGTNYNYYNIFSYVEWSLHEPFPGTYNFEGIADLEYFIKLIQDEGMYLLLRPGPYICAERDFVSINVVFIPYSYYKNI